MKQLLISIALAACVFAQDPNDAPTFSNLPAAGLAEANFHLLGVDLIPNANTQVAGKYLTILNAVADDLFNNTVHGTLAESPVGTFTYDPDGAGPLVAVPFSSIDLLHLDAAGVISQRNGVNPQEFRIYNTDSGSDDEYAALGWQTTSNVLRIGTVATGTGTLRALALNANGGNVGIGTASGPSSILHIVQSANVGATTILENANAGNSAFSVYEARNGTGTNDSLGLMAAGTGYITGGGYVQDSGILVSGSALSGGMSLISRHASGVIRFYTAGYTSERMRIRADGSIDIFDSTPSGSPVGGAQIYSTSGSFRVKDSAGNVAAFPAAAGTVALAGGNIGAATATTAAADNSSTLVATTAFVQTEINDIRIPLIIPISDETTDITTGDVKLTFRMPYAMTVTAVKLSATTASTSGIPTIDVNEAGVTILSTKLTLDVTERTSVTAAVPAVVSDTALAADAEITFDFDVAGTGTKGIKVTIIGTTP